ncbi:MAG: integrase arm-type DNA-binding domain-containing protein [Neisseria sp.]|uniref:tyrosine-type recombinase/integrase n=1 Tax=Neisseria sp. TaxID=192066 RepID=UPI0026DC6C7C|nr:integrase arm-type DNA-binding domain-containing protein [Neisseria sp.]MDO4640790.1 integrase arm-type DNA-binding domain-containing protein [Neisseria sp.]
MPLNDLQIKRTKASEKKQTLSDGGGLALVINPATRGGTKYFVYNYRFNGKQQTLRFGKYPDISLAEARLKHQQARNDLANGINPSTAKQEAKQARKVAEQNTFSAIACRWHTDNLHRWKPDHAKRVLRYFETDIFPYIGAMPINEIRVNHIKELISLKASGGTVETAEKLRQWIGAVFKYGAMLEINENNPAAVLTRFLPKREAAHMAALPETELVEFFRRLILADIKPQNRICILLIMLCFARNTEIRGGEWNEIDRENKIWTIPAHRMKRPRLHVIPLADWTLELLSELNTITGSGRFMFPSRQSANSYISENTASKIINNMGYKGVATPHGFRSLASSILNEQGFNPDAIERQLAHIEENRIRAAYNRADYMDERRKMMAWYADFLRERYEQAKALIDAG